MALINVTQPPRNTLVALLAARALRVVQDDGFQRVVRQEGWRFLVSIATEVRAAWVRTGLG